MPEFRAECLEKRIVFELLQVEERTSGARLFQATSKLFQEDRGNHQEREEIKTQSQVSENTQFFFGFSSSFHFYSFSDLFDFQVS